MYWISSKQSDPYIKTVRTLSGVRIVFWIFPQLDIPCTSVVKRYCAKRTIYCSSALEYGSKRNLPPCRSDLNLVNFLLRRALQQKLYRQDFRDVDNLNRVLFTAGSDKSDAMEGVRATQTAKKNLDGVYRVHRRHVELLLTYWCS